jgi:hypothetical protein
MLPNSKLKPEKLEEALVPDDSGDVEEVDAVDAVDGDVGEDGLNAVLRRRSDARGWSGWNREEGIVAVVGVRFVMVRVVVLLLKPRSHAKAVYNDGCFDVF